MKHRASLEELCRLSPVPTGDGLNRALSRVYPIIPEKTTLPMTS
ncbi:hypothetical protein GFS31_19360 [Leptolyngbya sp. BL0902]|nr:hypothetical protein GFS31_19360 [Leptolyngbya sp. BL0902]